MLRITDTVTGQAVTVEAGDIAAAIKGWYPQAPREVTAAIADLESRARRGEYTGEVEAFLAVRVEQA